MLSLLFEKYVSIHFVAGDAVTAIQQVMSACAFVFAMLFLALSVNRLCMHFGAGDSVTAYLRDRPRLTLLQKILLSLLRKPVLHGLLCRRFCYSLFER